MPKCANIVITKDPSKKRDYFSYLIGQSNNDFKMKKLRESWSLFYCLYIILYYATYINFAALYGPDFGLHLKKLAAEIVFSKYLAQYAFLYKSIEI